VAKVVNVVALGRWVKSRSQYVVVALVIVVLGKRVGSREEVVLENRVVEVRQKKSSVVVVSTWLSVVLPLPF